MKLPSALNVTLPWDRIGELHRGERITVEVGVVLENTGSGHVERAVLDDGVVVAHREQACR